MNKRSENPIKKGDLAEKMFELECIKRDIPIYVPVNSATRNDFLILINGLYKRVQIKYISAWEDNTIQVSFTKSQNGRKEKETGKPKYLKYDSTEVDLIYVYCPETELWYEIPISATIGRRCLTLRITPSKNGQHKNVNYATDYIW